MTEREQAFDRLYLAAARVLNKIDVEHERGTPLHPAGHADATWTRGEYPAEVSALDDAVQEWETDWRRGDER